MKVSGSQLQTSLMKSVNVPSNQVLSPVRLLWSVFIKNTRLNHHTLYEEKLKNDLYALYATAETVKGLTDDFILFDFNFHDKRVKQLKMNLRQVMSVFSSVFLLHIHLWARAREDARSRVRRCLWVSMSSGTPLRYWVTADGQVDFSEKRDCVHAPVRGRQISRADLVALNQSKNTRARRRVCLWCQSASSRLTEEVHVVTNWCASVKHAPSCGVKNTHLRLSPSLG